MASEVRNIAPFIDKEFQVTSEWWKERVNPVTGETEIHRGLDITTRSFDDVCSMLEGAVHSKGTNSTRGNWIIIYDNTPYSPTYGYATLYMHLQNLPLLPIGTHVSKNQAIAKEGSTGQSTGIHLHVEMQDIGRFNFQWHASYVKSDYIDPTVFMGIDNEYLSKWIYHPSTPPVPPIIINKKTNNFKWVLFNKRIKNLRKK